MPSLIFRHQLQYLEDWPLHSSTSTLWSPGTNSSSLTLRFPTFALESSFQAHFASTTQSCFGFVCQKPADSPLFYEFGISFWCKASWLPHNPRKDLVCQFECHTCSWKPHLAIKTDISQAILKVKIRTKRE